MPSASSLERTSESLVVIADSSRVGWLGAAGPGQVVSLADRLSDPGWLLQVRDAFAGHEPGQGLAPQGLQDPKLRIARRERVRDPLDRRAALTSVGLKLADRLALQVGQVRVVDHRAFLSWWLVRGLGAPRHQVIA